MFKVISNGGTIYGIKPKFVDLASRNPLVVPKFANVWFGIAIVADKLKKRKKGKDLG